MYRKRRELLPLDQSFPVLCSMWQASCCYLSQAPVICCVCPQYDMMSLKQDPRIREKFKLDRKPDEPTPLGDFYERANSLIRPRDDKDW